MANQYAGSGKILYLSINPGSFPAGNDEVDAYPLVAEIPVSGYSQAVAVNNAQVVSFQIKYAASPGAVTTIEYGSDPKLLDAIVFDTIPLSITNDVAVWTTEDNLNGFLRINNTSGEIITEVRVQKQVRV